MTSIATIAIALIGGLAGEYGRLRGRTTFERWAPSVVGTTVLVIWMMVVRPEMAPLTWAVWGAALLVPQALRHVMAPARPGRAERRRPLPSGGLST